MAFTQNQVQGVFGEFKGVLDGATVTFSVNNVQGIFGEFTAVLDEAAAVVGTNTRSLGLLGVGR